MITLLLTETINKAEVIRIPKCQECVAIVLNKLLKCPYLVMDDLNHTLISMKWR